MWLMAVLVCLSLALVHGGGLLLRYRTYPTRIQLSVSDRQGIPLPALTVCPWDRFDLARLESLWRAEMPSSPAAASAPDAKEQYYQLADRMPIDELWSRIAYPEASALFPMCYLGRGTECASVGNFSSIWTTSGTCFTYFSGQKTLSGHFHGLYLRLNISHQLGPSRNASGWKITLHDPGVSPLLTSSRLYTPITIRYDEADKSVRSQFVNSRLSPKEFVQVNHPARPCLEDDSSSHADDCELGCFEAAVISATRCKLPYMKTDRVPFCNTSESVRMAEESVAQLITQARSSLQCRCIEPCKKIVYKYQSESLTVNMTYGRLKVFYDTPLWSTVREVYIYSWIGLLCNVGNILCLLLGASVLTFFQIAELLLVKLSSWR